MVVIDEEEYNDLSAQVEEVDEQGKKLKFRKDKFYMKDMELAKTVLSEEKVRAWVDWLVKTTTGQFKENDVSDVNIEAIPLVELRPSLFSDTSALSGILERAEKADIKMKEAETLQKKRRKDRLKLFDACIKQYLNAECGANYKIKYDLQDTSYEYDRNENNKQSAKEIKN